jgi:hypothetical protein
MGQTFLATEITEFSEKKLKGLSPKTLGRCVGSVAKPTELDTPKNSSCRLKILVMVFGDMPSRSQERRGSQV